MDAFDIHIRADDDRGWAAIPTHDDLTWVVQGRPQSQFQANRKDVEGSYMKSFELAPEFAERMHGVIPPPSAGVRPAGGRPGATRTAAPKVPSP